MSVRLLRINPLTGAREPRCYYVVTNDRLMGRVRFNDGWNASYATGDRFETIGGTYRTRFTAVQAVFQEGEGEGVSYKCPSCGGPLQFVAYEGDGDQSYICTRCNDEWFGTTLGYPIENEDE